MIVPSDARSRRLLARIFSHDTPFGPSNAETFDVTNSADLDAIRTFFDSENKISKRLRKPTNIVFGRRGSGKTNILQSFVFRDGKFLGIFLSQHQAFRRVIELMDEKFEDNDEVFVEDVADIWKVLFRSLFLIEFTRRPHFKDLRKSSSFGFIKKYTDFFLKDAAEDSEIGLIDILADGLSVLFGAEKVRSGKDLIGKLTSFGMDFSAAWAAFERLAAIDQIEGAILLDSIEEIPLNFSKSRLCLSGLLKFLSSRHIDNDRNFKVTVALPTEQFYPFYGISSNPNKDFATNYLLVQWSGRELVQLAARRYLIYLQIHHAQNNLLARTIAQIDPTREGDLLRFFERIFGPKCQNKHGEEEFTVPYLLRHTQLIPRTFIDLLNQVAVTGNAEASPLNHKMVDLADAVRAKEESFCAEVFQAFRLRYPDAKNIAHCMLPELPRVFTSSDLHRIFTQQVKRQQNLGKVDATLTWEDVRRILIEIGAIGRIIEAPNRRDPSWKIRAEFEYTVPSQLPVDTKTKFCIHPMFSGTMANKAKWDSAWQVVYPEACEIDAEDYRRWHLP